MQIANYEKIKGDLNFPQPLENAIFQNFIEKSQSTSLEKNQFEARKFSDIESLLMLVGEVISELTQTAAENEIPMVYIIFQFLGDEEKVTFQNLVNQVYFNFASLGDTKLQELLMFFDSVLPASEAAQFDPELQKWCKSMCTWIREQLTPSALPTGFSKYPELLCQNLFKITVKQLLILHRSIQHFYCHYDGIILFDSICQLGGNYTQEGILDLLYLNLSPALASGELDAMVLIIDLTLTSTNLKSQEFKLTNSEHITQTLSYLSTVEKFLANSLSQKDRDVEKAVSFLQNPAHKRIVCELYCAEFDKVY